MRCASAIALGGRRDADSIVDELAANLEAGLGGDPSWLLLSHEQHLGGEALRRACRRRWPNTHLHRLSSMQGLLCQSGHHPGAVVGALGLRDPHGAFGTAACDIEDLNAAELRRAVAAVLDTAMGAAGRSGEAPELLFMSMTPGQEERVLEAIEAELGSVPVAGGTASGELPVGDGARSHQVGLVVSAFYPRYSPSVAFSSGYVPSGELGAVTAADGRCVLRIDGEPAALVYDRWTGGTLRKARALGQDKPVHILPETSLVPLGRRGVGEDHHHYLLSHPEWVHPDGSISFLTSMKRGDRLELMRGSPQGLLRRAPSVARAARQESERPVAGGIVLCCAGCMLAMGQRISEVPAPLKAALEAPYLGVFTFGEQGYVPARGNLHGNLMFSVVTFHG